MPSRPTRGRGPTGLQPSSGGAAADAQSSSTLGGGTFGRDPNSLTNANGRLPNDRPHMFRSAVSWEVPRIGIHVAGNLQFLSGKPWAATTQISLPQGDQRILLEPRGTQRLPSVTMFDLRVSKMVRLGDLGRVELLMDVLNAFNRRHGRGAGYRQPVQSELRAADGLRGSAARDARRAAELWDASSLSLASFFKCDPDDLILDVPLPRGRYDGHPITIMPIHQPACRVSTV